MRPRLIAVAGLISMVVIAVVWWYANLATAKTKGDNAGVSFSPSRLWVIRLHPGDDLVDTLTDFAKNHSINAGGIVTCVGSLSRAHLRLANQSKYTDLQGPFEIVSFVGTISTTGHHFHLALSDADGHVVGGHASSGNTVFTTAEIIIAEGINWTFRREVDPGTGYTELYPAQRNGTLQNEAQ